MRWSLLRCRLWAAFPAAVMPWLFWCPWHTGDCRHLRVQLEQWEVRHHWWSIVALASHVADHRHRVHTPAQQGHSSRCLLVAAEGLLAVPSYVAMSNIGTCLGVCVSQQHWSPVIPMADWKPHRLCAQGVQGTRPCCWCAHTMHQGIPQGKQEVTHAHGCQFTGVRYPHTARTACSILRSHWLLHSTAWRRVTGLWVLSHLPVPR